MEFSKIKIQKEKSKNSVKKNSVKLKYKKSKNSVKEEFSKIKDKAHLVLGWGVFIFLHRKVGMFLQFVTVNPLRKMVCKVETSVIIGAIFEVYERDIPRVFAFLQQDVAFLQVIVGKHDRAVDLVHHGLDVANLWSSVEKLQFIHQRFIFIAIS